MNDHGLSVMPEFLGRSGRRILKKADSTVSPQFYQIFVSFCPHHVTYLSHFLIIPHICLILPSPCHIFVSFYPHHATYLSFFHPHHATYLSHFRIFLTFYRVSIFVKEEGFQPVRVINVKDRETSVL